MWITEPITDNGQTADDSQIGETVSLEQYKSLQAEHTRKAQELADLKKQLASSGQSDEDPISERNEYLKHTKPRKEDVETIKSQIEAERNFNELLDANPELKPQAKAIAELARLNNMAYEDVIENYWFGNMTKLKQAKERGLIGDRWNNQIKDISDASDDEYAQWKKANLGKSKLLHASDL